MSTEQTPELGPGSPPATFLVGEPDSSGTTLTITEAAQRLGVSVTTLRRRLKEGKVSGAHKAPGPDGEEWRIPVASIPEPSDNRTTTNVEDDLRRQLDNEKRARELAEALLDSERRGREELSRTVDVLREAIETLHRALPPVSATTDVKSARWWKRSKKQGSTTP